MKLFHIIFFSIIFFSCEKPVDIKLNSLSTQLVVEGYIQQDYPAYVFLTRSESYFNSVDSNTLNNISVDFPLTLDTLNNCFSDLSNAKQNDMINKIFIKIIIIHPF